MQRSSSQIAVLISLILAPLAASLCGQSAPPAPPPAPYPGLINDYLRTSDPKWQAWDVGVNVRLRDENKDGAGTTDAGSNWDFSRRPQDDNINDYFLSRVMPRVGYTSEWFSAYVEGRSSYSYGDERYNATAPGFNLPERDGPIDLYQGYVIIGDAKKGPFTAKIGRQELVYGDQRLVGHSRWTNNARTFDAIKLRYQSDWLTADLFTGGVVYVVNNKFNQSNSQDAFSGLYLTLPKASERETIETYLLARNVARGIATDNWSQVAAPARFPGAQDVYTLGFRLKSKPKSYGPWDYTLEAMYQFGDRTAVFPGSTVAAALSAPRLRQQAYGLVYQLGYSWTELACQPRLALIYSYASGDNDPNDGHSGTFQNLFPSNHGFYGAMDLSGLQNLHDVRLNFTAKPLKSLTLGADAHLQFLDTTSDFWYNVAGAPRNFTGAAVGSGRGYRINPAYGRGVGQELDLLAGWSVTKYALLEVAYAHFFRGDYIKDSLSAVGSKDANYVYVQTTFNF